MMHYGMSSESQEKQFGIGFVNMPVARHWLSSHQVKASPDTCNNRSVVRNSMFCVVHCVAVLRVAVLSIEPVHPREF
jgi:hypothetical protein